MNETDELYMSPSDFSFLRSIGVKCTAYCQNHPNIELPPSRQPRKGERRHHRGCYLCQRVWRKRRQRHLAQLKLPMPTKTFPDVDWVSHRGSKTAAKFDAEVNQWGF
jgi:hypothetical protein